MRYKESDPFYRRAAWLRLRRQALERDHYICQDCLAEADAGHMRRPRAAEMVHHIIPMEQRPDLALDIDNLVSLCNDCHAKRHPEKGAHGAQKPIIKNGVTVFKI